MLSLPLQPSKNMVSLQRTWPHHLASREKKLSSCFSFCFNSWGAPSPNWSLSQVLPTSLWQTFCVPALSLAPSSFLILVFPFHPFSKKSYCPVCISVNLLTHLFLELGKVEINNKKEIGIVIVVRKICIE